MLSLFGICFPHAWGHWVRKYNPTTGGYYLKRQCHHCNAQQEKDE